MLKSEIKEQLYSSLTRVDNYRYTEYLDVKDHGDQTWEPLWDKPADHEELYDLEIDPQERINR